MSDFQAYKHLAGVNEPASSCLTCLNLKWRLVSVSTTDLFQMTALALHTLAYAKLISSNLITGENMVKLLGGEIIV